MKSFIPKEDAYNVFSIDDDSLTMRRFDESNGSLKSLHKFNKQGFITNFYNTNTNFYHTFTYDFE